MGAMINIAFDAELVSAEDAKTLAESLQKIVEKEIGEKDVFVYADSAVVSVAVEPIEVFVQVNGRKVTDAQDLTDRISTGIVTWKRDSNFGQPINLNVIPVDWYSKVRL